MKVLEKCLLDQKLASEYFKASIGNHNTISREVLKMIDFQKGSFFTLLPRACRQLIINLYSSPFQADDETSS